MVWVDIAILVIVGLSALISVIRGFVREALSLAGWILAFWVGLTFAGQFDYLLADFIEDASLRAGVSFVILFLTTLLITGLINYLVARLISKTGLTGTDRTLGIVFGIARGAVVVAILVLLAGLTTMPQDPWWSESMFLVHFQALAEWMRDLLPPEFASYFNYT